MKPKRKRKGINRDVEISKKKKKKGITEAKQEKTYSILLADTEKSIDAIVVLSTYWKERVITQYIK